jgi:hypothetical protein
MSSSILKTIQNYLIVYGYSISMILGNIGNVFIVIIFSRQRQTACAIYLICAAVMNIFFVTYSSIAEILLFYYPDRMAGVTIFCKLYRYIVYIVGEEADTMLVLACIDRFLITSDRDNFRAFSTPKRAKYLIFFSFIFWTLFTIHLPIMLTVVNGRCTTPGVYSIIYSVFTIIVVGLIPSITLVIFGYLAYHNMRKMQNRIQPVGRNTIDGNISIQRRDRDLLIIILAEILVYVVTTSPFPLIELAMLIGQYVMPNTSFQYFEIEIFIINLAVFSLFVSSAAPFYTYLISSKSFRREFKQLIMKSYWKLRRQTPVETVSRIDRTVTQPKTRV